MGYTTEFSGRFQLDRPLTPEHLAYLKAFSQTRRMQRNSAQTSDLADPVRIAVGLPVGVEGGYFVGAPGNYGQGETFDVIDGNCEPSGQPSLWCNWEPTDDGKAIEWSGAEKFYNYVEWLRYIIRHFLAPWGYKLNGDVKWYGEEHSDQGIITVEDNWVTMKKGRLVYE